MRSGYVEHHVRLLAQLFRNDIQAMIAEYHRWHNDGRRVSLTEHFGLEQ